MSRPKPKIILSNPEKNYRATQVLEADAIYAVFHEGKAINLKLIHTMRDDVSPKYLKNSFSNEAHAHNLRNKLNKMFKTEKFDVYKLTLGEKILEN